jgi:hypothetical protein
MPRTAANLIRNPRTDLDQAVDLQALEEALESAWSAETSWDPAHWNSANPAWGQCAVTALLIQESFGGILLVSMVGGIQHYWNRLPNGREIDLTRQQFGVNVSPDCPPESASREYVLSFPDTRRRYDMIRRRVEETLKSGS